MKNRFTLSQCIVILILSLLTALEPLCIDLYLPGFLSMEKALATTSEAIKISLSTFLAGFALGQLIWGPLADKFGRKKPILVSLGIFVLASTACMFVQTIEQLWIIRFIQALSGCGGVVISRAVVTDSFHKDDTLKVFSLLALIMGVAPIIAPGVGDMVMKFFDWRGLFGTMAVLGAFMFILTILFLPESYKPNVGVERKRMSVVKDYLEVLKVKPFVIYSLLSGIVNGSLMLYISNGPFLIEEIGGYSRTQFSLIFGVNALGIVGGSLFASFAQRYMPTRKLLKAVVILELLISIVVLAFMYLNVPFTLILLSVFCFIVPLGVLFPVTTELALTPFSENGGTASALFGSIQLLVAFIATVLGSALTDGSMTSVGVSFFLCSLIAFFTVFYNPKTATQKLG